MYQLLVLCVLLAPLSRASFVTWGSQDFGGNSTSIAMHFSSCGSVEAIECSSGACAFLRDDGSVFVAGHPAFGGNVSRIEGLLTNVTELSAGDFTFGALRNDGTAVHWGFGTYGGDVEILSNVTRLFGGRQARVALLQDGSLVCWGKESAGGNCTHLEDIFLHNVSDVKDVRSNAKSFVALTHSGRAVAWGSETGGGNASLVSQNLLNGVVEVVSTDAAHLALKKDGGFVVWGSLGDDSEIPDLNLNEIVVDAFASSDSFAILTDNRTLVVFGALETEVFNVVSVSSARRGFVVLHEDNSVTIIDENDGITFINASAKEVFANDGGAYLIVLQDDNLLTSGNLENGGNSSFVRDAVERAGGLQKVWAGPFSFLAQLKDNSVLAWGRGDRGGFLPEDVANFLAGGYLDRVVAGIDVWAVSKKCVTASPSQSPSVSPSLAPTNSPSVSPTRSPIERASRPPSASQENPTNESPTGGEKAPSPRTSTDGNTEDIVIGLVTSVGAIGLIASLFVAHKVRNRQNQILPQESIGR